MITKDFKEFLELLNAHHVEYLIVGGHAVIFHGYPRYTGDIDIWVSNKKENADKLVKVLDNFGFASLNLTAKDFMSEDVIIQLGYPPDRIDIITSVEALIFDDCYARKIVAKVDSIMINFISKEDLKKNKKALGRNRDLDDCENL